MIPPHEEATRLQAELTLVTERIADEISRHPRRRNAEEIQRLWRGMDPIRRKLKSQQRALRKYDRLSLREARRKDFTAQKEVVRQVRLLGKRLAMWGDMEALVERHIAPEPSPLEWHTEPTAMDELLSMMYMSLFQMSHDGGQSDEAREFGAYADIPFPIQAFDRLMHMAYRIALAQNLGRDIHFLDVGCGSGTKVLAASRYFPVSHGLDYQGSYVERATRLFEKTKSQSCYAFVENGLNFAGYGAYDVIYFYRPMRETEDLMRLERKVFDTARKGAIVVAPYDTFSQPRKEMEGASLGGPVFLAGSVQEEADALAERARYTDTDIIRRSRDMSFDTGFWQPLLDAATYNVPV